MSNPVYPDRPNPTEPEVAGVDDIVAAVLSLEYGAVTVSVKGGQVVRLERHEKLRLPNPKRAVHPVP